MPSPLHNGESIMTAVGGGGAASSWSKVRRFGALLLLLRLAALCFCLAAAVFAATDTSVLHLRPFRLLLAANAIVAVYSVFEGGAATWEMVRGTTLLPEPLQLWFDFSHDQVFGYLAVAAGAAAARDASMCNKLVQNERNTSCLQAYIAVGLGFAGFAFLAISSLASGYRLVCFLVTGSRFPSSILLS